MGIEFRHLLDDVEIDRTHSMAVTQPGTVFSFVEAGLGLGLIGTLPARMMYNPGLVYRPLDHPEASREITAHWAATRRLSPAGSTSLRALIDFTQDHDESKGHRHAAELSSPPRPTEAPNLKA